MTGGYWYSVDPVVAQKVGHLDKTRNFVDIPYGMYVLSVVGAELRGRFRL
jgi:hypothetical protein